MRIKIQISEKRVERGAEDGRLEGRRRMEISVRMGGE
jgi:hypothetical protein